VFRVRPYQRTGVRTAGSAYSRNMAVVVRAGSGGWKGRRAGAAAAAAAGAALLTVSVCSIDEWSAQLMN
jgi:hypothetical protein